MVLDGSFWKGLLGFELDVFYREQANVFETNSSAVPYTFSYILPLLNSREVSNRGFDIMLTHKNRINDDFSYNVNAMFSWNRQRVEKTLTDQLIDVNDIDPADFASDDDYQAAIDEANQFNFINRTEGQWTNRYFGYVSMDYSSRKSKLIITLLIKIKMVIRLYCLEISFIRI